MKNAVLIAAVLLTSSGLASAQDGTVVQGRYDPLVERVSYEASELTSDDGIKALRKRVHRAAVQVCKAPEAFMAPFHQQYCVNPTLRDAYAQVDQAVVQSRAGVLSSSDYIVVRVR